jgi:hypothetical protein
VVGDIELMIMLTERNRSRLEVRMRSLLIDCRRKSTRLKTLVLGGDLLVLVARAGRSSQ